MLKYPGQIELGTAMTGQETGTLGAVIPYAPEAGNSSPEADLVDRAGNAILGLVRTIVAPSVGAIRHKTKTTTPRDSRFCDVGKITRLKSSRGMPKIPISKRALFNLYGAPRG